MNPPKFIAKPFDGRFEYHLPVPIERFLAQTIYNNSAKAAFENHDDLYSFIVENNISSCSSCYENAMIYTIALKKLGHNKKCFLVYFDSPNDVLAIQADAKPLKVEWWNSIQFISGYQFCENFGFQTPKLFLKTVDYFDKSLANRYFYMAEIDFENIHKYTEIYGCSVTNWFFIFCENENQEKIRSMMTLENEKPCLDSLLSLSSTIVNVQIGGDDEDYFDYILIQSKADISPLIQDIETAQRQFIQHYGELLKIFLIESFTKKQDLINQNLCK